MIFLIIAALIVCIIVVLLLCMVKIDVSFFGEFKYKVSLAGITVYKPKEEKETQEQKPDTPQPTKKKEPNFFEKIKEKRGFTGAVKELFSFAGDCLKKIKKLLKHVKVRKLFLNITVAGSDAAATAIEYGAVCAAVYPVLSLVTSVADVKLKQIDIKSDFDVHNPDMEFSFSISVRVIHLLVTALKLFSEYKKFKLRNDL